MDGQKTTAHHLGEMEIGQAAQSRLSEMHTSGVAGARAALETFYHAFNTANHALMHEVWAEGRLARLCNPVGGVLEGGAAIHGLYDRLFGGPARVWVAFYDIIEYAGEGVVVFSGRERGEYAKGRGKIPLAIRTTRIFAWGGPEIGWRQVHHHGSIDDAKLLARYQKAVLGK